MSANPQHVLLIEDEPRVAAAVARAIQEAGYELSVAETAAAAETLWKEGKPDVVILDLGLPDRDGLDLLADIRESGLNTPVLVLSARSSMSDRVTGLDSGADDYLGKPFGVEELLARIRVMLRRRTGPPEKWEAGNIKIDFATRKVTRSGRIVFLSETEYRLFEHLAHNAGKAVSKKELLQAVWDDPDRDDNVVEVYVNYLRGKLEWGGEPRLIHTIRGKGYVLGDELNAP